MVARGIGQHTPLPLFGGELRQGIKRSPKFKGSSALKIFTLEEYLTTDAPIDRSRSQDWSPMSLTCQPIRGCFHLSVGDRQNNFCWIGWNLRELSHIVPPTVLIPKMGYKTSPKWVNPVGGIQSREIPLK
jgi:hypothetical protein